MRKVLRPISEFWIMYLFTLKVSSIWKINADTENK